METEYADEQSTLVERCKTSEELHQLLRQFLLVRKNSKGIPYQDHIDHIIIWGEGDSFNAHVVYHRVMVRERISIDKEELEQQ